MKYDLVDKVLETTEESADKGPTEDTRTKGSADKGTTEESLIEGRTEVIC